MQNVQKIVFVVISCVGSMQGALPPVITHPSQIDWTALGIEYAPAGDATPSQIVHDLQHARKNRDVRTQQVLLARLVDTVCRGDAHQGALAIVASAFEHGNVVREKDQNLANFLMEFVGARAYRDAQEKGFLFGPRAQDASTQTDDAEVSEADRAAQITEMRAALVAQLPGLGVTRNVVVVPPVVPVQQAVKKCRKNVALSPLASPAVKAAAAAKRAQQNQELADSLNERASAQGIVFETVSLEASSHTAPAQSEPVQIPVVVAAQVVPAVAVEEQPVIAAAPKRSYLQVATDAVRSAFGMPSVDTAAAKEVGVQQTQDANPDKSVAHTSKNKKRGEHKAHKAAQQDMPQQAQRAPQATAAPAIATANPFAALPVEEVPVVLAASYKVVSNAEVIPASTASSVVDASEGSASGVSINSVDTLLDALNRKDKSLLYELLQANLAVLASDEELADKEEAFNRISTILCNSDVRHPAREQVALFVASGDHNGIFACFNDIALNSDAADRMVQQGLKASDVSPTERGKLAYVAAHVALLNNDDAARMEHLKEACKYGHQKAQADLLAIAVHLSSAREYAQARPLFEQLKASGFTLPQHAEIHYAQCMAEHDRLKEKAAAARKEMRKGAAASHHSAVETVRRVGGEVIGAPAQVVDMIRGLEASAADQMAELNKLESKWNNAQLLMNSSHLDYDLYSRLYKQNIPYLVRIIELKNRCGITSAHEQTVLKEQGERRAAVIIEHRATLTDALEKHMADIDLFQAYVDAGNFDGARHLCFELVRPLSYWVQPENADLFAVLRKLSEDNPKKSAEIAACKKNMAVKLYQLAQRVSPSDMPAIEKLVMHIKDEDCRILGMKCDELSHGSIRITMPDGSIVTAPAELAQAVFEECVQTIVAAQAQQQAHAVRAGSSANA